MAAPLQGAAISLDASFPGALPAFAVLRRTLPQAIPLLPFRQRAGNLLTASFHLRSKTPSLRTTITQNPRKPRRFSCGHFHAFLFLSRAAGLSVSIRGFTFLTTDGHRFTPISAGFTAVHSVLSEKPFMALRAARKRMKRSGTGCQPVQRLRSPFRQRFGHVANLSYIFVRVRVLFWLRLCGYRSLRVLRGQRFQKTSATPRTLWFRFSLSVVRILGGARQFRWGNRPTRAEKSGTGSIIPFSCLQDHWP